MAKWVYVYRLIGLLEEQRISAVCELNNIVLAVAGFHLATPKKIKNINLAANNAL